MHKKYNFYYPKIIRNDCEMNSIRIIVGLQ